MSATITPIHGPLGDRLWEQYRVVALTGPVPRVLLIPGEGYIIAGGPTRKSILDELHKQFPRPERARELAQKSDERFVRAFLVQASARLQGAL